MPYLAIDTASRWTALALYDADRDEILAEKGWTATQRQTVELAPSLEQMLADRALSAADLTALVVAIGPGSYTGLRIGLSLARGIAAVHQLPIAAIQTHDIVAANIPADERPLYVTVEAGRKRVLVAPYRWEGERWEQLGEITNPTWLELIESIDRPIMIAGEIPAELRTDRTLAPNRIEFISEDLSRRSAAVLAQLGHRQIMAGQLPDQRRLAPNYINSP